MFDMLFSGVTAVTMNDTGDILNDAYIGITGSKIAYIGQEPPQETAKSIIKGTRNIVMPGIVNSHTHVPMTVLRGISDDDNLQDWLNNYIFPTEKKLDNKCVYWASQLGLADMMSSGTVSITDMYDFCDSVAESVSISGMKANISRGTTLFAPDLDWKLFKGAVEMRELADKWHGFDDGRILVDVSIHAEYTSHDKLWKPFAEYALEKGLGMHVHLSETAYEHSECIKKYGLTPAAVLNASGVFGVRTTAAHCVHITEDDMDILAARGVTAAHNPVSNLKLGCGVAHIIEMQGHGINVALGTDSVASNNSHDMFEEIKVATIMQKNRNPKYLSGQTALRMATVCGAVGQGRAKETGRLEIGRDADIIMLDFDKPHLWPCLDVVSSLTYSVRGSDVCLNMVRGKILYREGQHLTLDVEKIRHEVYDYVLPTLGLNPAL